MGGGGGGGEAPQLRQFCVVNAHFRRHFAHQASLFFLHLCQAVGGWWVAKKQPEAVQFVEVVPAPTPVDASKRNGKARAGMFPLCMKWVRGLEVFGRHDHLPFWRCVKLGHGIVDVATMSSKTDVAVHARTEKSSCTTRKTAPLECIVPHVSTQCGGAMRGWFSDSIVGPVKALALVNGIPLRFARLGACPGVMADFGQN